MSKQADLKLKVVVRRLPAKLPEPVFKQTIAPFLPHIEYFHYDQGLSTTETRPSSGSLAEDITSKCPSTAYMQFKTQQNLLEFYRVFNGWKFVSSSDPKRVDFAMVEYAPFQRVPPAQISSNGTSSAGTGSLLGDLEETEEFKQFMDALNGIEVEEGSDPVNPLDVLYKKDESQSDSMAVEQSEEPALLKFLFEKHQKSQLQQPKPRPQSKKQAKQAKQQQQQQAGGQGESSATGTGKKNRNKKKRKDKQKQSTSNDAPDKPVQVVQQSSVKQSAQSQSSAPDSVAQKQPLSASTGPKQQQQNTGTAPPKPDESKGKAKKHQQNNQDNSSKRGRRGRGGNSNRGGEGRGRGGRGRGTSKPTAAPGPST